MTCAAPRTLDIALTAAVFVPSVSESLLSAGVDRPALGRRAALRRDEPAAAVAAHPPVAMSVALVALVLPTAAFVVDPSELISTFLPL